MSYHKVKSVAKRVTAKGPALEKIVLSTMKLASDVVGATLGPGGMPVLIERQEHAMPPVITKDGVTVFRSLGFEDSTAHVVMEAARDAAVRTASEAGDGTTTATVLSEAIVRRMSAFVAGNPRTSPQRIVRRLESVFRDKIEPVIKEVARRPADEEERGSLLYSVAKTSANGDGDLADRVLECYDLVGDDGNVTIVEVTGPSGYEVEAIDGYSIGVGYEESCARFYQKFINDPGTMSVKMAKPVFLLYHGKITEIQSLRFILEGIGELWQDAGFHHNVVVVATGFSESVLSNLAVNFAHPTTINVFPLLAPQTIDPNSQLHFLEDVAALTGAKVLDPMNAPLDKAAIQDLGYGEGLNAFEATRGRSTIIGFVKDQEAAIAARAEDLRVLADCAVSELDKILTLERLGKLTNGIAKLKVLGVSNGETKEKRDRAEDAVCAVRGAIRHGTLPGGGWTLLKVCSLLDQEDPIIKDILIPALKEPVIRLLKNCGQTDEEIEGVIAKITAAAIGGEPEIFDALEGRFVNAYEAGVVDSTPAVLEAIRNSLSIASLLGTLGGTIVFGRDTDLERSEARETANFLRNIEEGNAANERP
jgi:chaperonin GroEL